MVITVVTVRMMQSAINKIISVITMWNLLMTTTGAMLMFCVMTFGYRVAAIGIFLADL